MEAKEKLKMPNGYFKEGHFMESTVLLSPSKNRNLFKNGIIFLEII